MKSVIVCGSHTRGDKGVVYNALDTIHKRLKFDLLFTGGADFIDTFAMGWAMARRIDHVVRYANWNVHGTWAGPVRNRLLLDDACARAHTPSQYPALLAFDGDNGTVDMISQARERQITIYKFHEGKWHVS